jgi:hypothetical protein
MSFIMGDMGRDSGQGGSMDRAGYEATILARLGEGVRVPFRDVRVGEWQPVPNDCHNNVDTWVGAHAEQTAVRGWLVESVCSLTAHSVVRDQDGGLYDITPFRDDSLRLDFIEHQGDAASFNQMKAAGVQIFGYTVDPDDLAKYLAEAVGDFAPDDDAEGRE